MLIGEPYPQVSRMTDEIKGLPTQTARTGRRAGGLFYVRAYLNPHSRLLRLGITYDQCPVRNLPQPSPVHDDIAVPGLL